MKNISIYKTLWRCRRFQTLYISYQASLRVKAAQIPQRAAIQFLHEKGSLTSQKLGGNQPGNEAEICALNLYPPKMAGCP